MGLFSRPKTGAHLTLFRAAIVQSPTDAEGFLTYASQLADAGDPVDARAWVDRALAISPDAAVCEGSAALALRTGDLAVAGRGLRRALASDPQHVSRHLALARVHQALARHAAWLTEGRRALGLASNSAEAWRIVALLMRRAGRLADALAAGRRAASLAPSDPGALAEAARAEHALGLSPDAGIRVERALACAPDQVEHANLAVLVASYAGPPERLGAAVRRHAALVGRTRPHETKPQDPRSDRPLRVGYVSADLYDHPVGHNLIGLLEGHDRDRFDVFCYASVARPDDTTRRFRDASRTFRSVLGLGDAAVRDLVEVDRIDILVHVASRFSGNRPGLPAEGAAPVQLALFDLTSGGTDRIDATFVDADLHPEDSREYFAERVHRLPNLYLFDPPPAPDSSSLPSRRKGFVTFGSANNPAKWSAETLALWAAILTRIPTARLWLKFHDRTGDAETEAVMRRRLGEHGLPLERVDFGAGAVAKADHLGALAETVDIALDPHPFGGATASFEALWMGLPVVTLAGDRMVGRTSAMLLRHVGLTDLVAASPDAYVDIACGLASDAGRLQDLRQTLRARLAASPLLDRAAYVSAVERAYREAWSAACERHHASHISR